MSKPPPLKTGAERRQHKRVDIIAQVQLKTGGDVLLLQAKNISVGGMFLEGEPKEHPQLAPPVAVDVALSPEDDLEGEPILMKARIVRISRGDGDQPPGFGLAIMNIDSHNQ